jgi:hypothetical protein
MFKTELEMARFFFKPDRFLNPIGFVLFQFKQLLNFNKN